MLQTLPQEVVPVLDEERLLGDTEQAGEEGEDGEAVLGFGGRVEGGGIQHLHEVLQAWYVHLVLHALGKINNNKLNICIIIK